VIRTAIPVCAAAAVPWKSWVAANAALAQYTMRNCDKASFSV
jgi:hypothetical protein